MSLDLFAVSLHARSSSAERRAAFAQELAQLLPADAILLTTCHRVEAFGSRRQLEPLLDRRVPAGAETWTGSAVARHLARLAVGLDSAVVAEDQVLHQLREALHAARSRGPLPAPLGRLFDLALRAGRRARTWLPPRSRGVAELALGRVLAAAVPVRPVLIVGAGEIGRRAARAVTARGGSVLVASRTAERADALAADARAQSVPFEPAADVLAGLEGVVVALAGRWPLSEDGRAALAGGSAWLIDLSAPPAIEPELARLLDGRLLTIDELARAEGAALSDRLLARFEELVDHTVADYLRWCEHQSQRRLAQALTEKATEAQTSELVALWQRLPDLAPEQRAEVERMARHLTERLLRDPLEQLDRDGDGRHARAARELFRL